MKLLKEETSLRILYPFATKHHIIEKMNQEKKEEIYESKLRFFTNITHEFCTPLTLIYGPCEKILAYTGTDPYIRKYGQMIKQNAERLNSLILELLEFRRLETDNKPLAIQRLFLSETTTNIADSFTELASTVTHEEATPDMDAPSIIAPCHASAGPEKTVTEFDPAKQTIMVIDDDPSMLWFVSEIFVENYNVLSFSNAQEALEGLEQKQPDLIISDVMMPETDGLTFTQKIKQNKLWKHIPLILLSALHNEDEQVKGIESGAEAYVTKPFNVKYLEKIVIRLIQRKSDLKEYYSSIFSAVKIDNGTYMHKEDQEFLDKVIQIIEKNISNPDLSVELLSNDLGYSSRQFYRKLKPITEKSPTDIIKEYRLTAAERLLLHGNLTIEEIMGRTGFNNRATFYKLFTARFGMPPRQYKEQQMNYVEKEHAIRLKDKEKES